MSNISFRLSLIELNKKIGGLYELDWFYAIGSKVDYKKVEHKTMVKENVDHAIGGLSILYLFAIFETYFPTSEWDNYIDPDKLKVLRAYRHVRHCVAHGSHGERVIPKTKSNQKEYDNFDDCIDNDLFPSKNIIQLDKSTNKISIDPTNGHILKQFMMNIVSMAIAQT